MDLFIRKKTLKTASVINEQAYRLHRPTEGWTRFASYPFFDWNDLMYCNFMLEMFKRLEPRFFQPKEILLGELEESQEMIFVTEGKYDIGYELNKVLKLRMTFGERTIIGAFNMCFD